MKVLITGGTGLIGKALAQSLALEGHSVLVLSRNPLRKPSPIVTELIKIEFWDGISAKGWAHFLEETDAIVHLAGDNISSGYWTKEKKRRIKESRILSGHAIVEAVAQVSKKPKLLIQGSAVGYYGPRADEPVSEEEESGSDFLAKDVTVPWEASTRPVEDFGIRRVIVRTGIVLSNKGGALPRMVLPFEWFLGGPLGDGKQWMPWIHLSDYISALCFLMQKEEAQGPFNLTAPTPVTNRDFARTIGKVLGRPSILPVPAFALKLLFGQMSSVLLNGQRALPTRLMNMGFAFKFTEAEKALRDLLL